MALDRLCTRVEATRNQGLLPGSTLLNGTYVITATLNSGGFGMIYLAKDALDQVVVLKECFPTTFCYRDGLAVMPRGQDESARFDVIRRCFRNEAKVLATLAHPNIVRAHRVFEDNGTDYMALDRLHGTDLLDLMDAGTRSFSSGEVIDLAQKLIGAVGYLHRIGLLHCDISPDNIVLTPSGEPVLIDFGAARAVVPQPGQAYVGPRVVKDGYSPPEQYLPCASLGPSSDLYAVAASLYHLISGTLPESADLRLAASNNGKPDPCRPLAGSIAGFPAGFLESIDKAMKVVASERFASAADWLCALAPRPAGQEKPVLLVRRSVKKVTPLQASMASSNPGRIEQAIGH